jgi:hypothetical protein
MSRTKSVIRVILPETASVLHRREASVKQVDQVTLTEYLLEHQRAHPEATGELTELLNRIALCGKIIARRLRRSTLTGDTATLTSNVYGERQEKLDVFANEVFLRHLRYGGIVSIAASEEMDEPKMFDADGAGHYTVSFDPIDGSSNLDVNGTLGTIFGIRRREAAGQHDHGLLTSGRDQIAAGYLLYGPARDGSRRGGAWRFSRSTTRESSSSRRTESGCPRAGRPMPSTRETKASGKRERAASSSG